MKTNQIAACPKCGSTEIKMGTMSEGITFGVTSWKSVCPVCGYQGEPLLFDSNEEYKKFLEELSSGTPDQEKETHEPTSPQSMEDEIPPASKKDEETIHLLQEDVTEEQLQQETTAEGVFPKNKSWWREIALAMIIAAFVIGVDLFNIVGENDTLFLIIYDLLFFVILTVFELIVIAVIEYIYYSIKRNLVKK